MIGRMETEWVTYRHLVLPKNASGTQLRECKRAFYAGADMLLVSILSMLEGGSEPTASEMAKMDALAAELRQFAADVKAGRE